MPVLYEKTLYILGGYLCSQPGVSTRDVQTMDIDNPGVVAQIKPAEERLPMGTYVVSHFEQNLPMCT